MKRLLHVLFGSEPGPVYCAECGAANPPGSNYCMACGKMLNP